MSQKILELLESVPTLQLTHGELDADRPVIIADEEPIFRVRTSPVGRAYANLIVEVIPQLRTLLGAPDGDNKALDVTASAPSPNQSSQADATPANEAEVRRRIESVLSLQPELKSKLQVMSKLVFAAVSTFLVGAKQEQSFSLQSVAPSKAHTKAIRSSAVSEFASWLAESGHLPLKDEAALDEVLIQWEETQHEGS